MAVLVCRHLHALHGGKLSISVVSCQIMIAIVTSLPVQTWTASVLTRNFQSQCNDRAGHGQHLLEEGARRVRSQERCGPGLQSRGEAQG